MCSHSVGAAVNLVPSPSLSCGVDGALRQGMGNSKPAETGGLKGAFEWWMVAFCNVVMHSGPFGLLLEPSEGQGGRREGSAGPTVG